MTEAMIDLPGLIAKSEDGGLRELICNAAERLMEIEVSALCGAGHGQRTPLRERFPDVATLMDEAEHDVLTHMAFDGKLRRKLHSTNPLERAGKQIKRRTNVVGIFPNRDAPLVHVNMHERQRSCASSARCCLSRTTNGPSRADTCQWKV